VDCPHNARCGSCDTSAKLALCRLRKNHPRTRLGRKSTLRWRTYFEANTPLSHLTSVRSAFVVIVASVAFGPVACVGSRSGAARQVAAAADLAAIDRLHQADMRAVIASDTATLMSLWTDDIVALPPGRGAVVGRAANAASLRTSMAQSVAFVPLEYVLDFQQVELVGDHAIEWGTYRGSVRPREGGSPITYRGNVLRVLRRMPNGSWRVARTMYSQE
jgi:ketosteroid isomerase-like protein